MESSCSLVVITGGACGQSDLGGHVNDGVGDFAEDEAFGPIGSACSATAAAQSDAHEEFYAEVAKQAAISGRDAESICSLSRADRACGQSDLVEVGP